MKRAVLILFFLLMGRVGIAQKAVRNPDKKVQSYRKSTNQNPENQKEGEVELFDGLRRIVIHKDGTLTVTMPFTQIAPNQFSKEQAEDNRVNLSSLKWSKAELLSFIQGLEESRSITSRSEDVHRMALQNGWYHFTDSVIIEAYQLLNSLE